MAFATAMQSEKQFFGASPRLFATLVLLLFIAFSLPHTAQARSNPRYASFVIDADTGMILHQAHADRSLHPASLAKMMTLLLTFEAIENGDMTLRDRVVMSRHAASMVPSKLNLPVGSSIRVEDAIYALVTKSANDVAVALGEKIAGTEGNFAVYMNRKAKQIGMSHTHFTNASGLHNPKQVTSARDMAKLARYILKYYPSYYHYFSTASFTYRGKTYRNHNKLMRTYSGMDGFKTGYISAAGFNLVASAKRNNHRLIGVVFGGRTSASRNAHMKKLLDEGFAELNTILVAKSVPIPERKPVNGATEMASLEPANGIEDMGQWADLNPMLQNKTFRELIGEGDYDLEETKRFETGLIAIAAVKGVYDTQVISSSARKTGEWSIQVGAFQSRVKTDKVIKVAQQTLPADLAAAAPIIVPLKTAQGWLFRGRLNGYSKDDALRACSLLKDCMPISPQAH